MSRLWNSGVTVHVWHLWWNLQIDNCRKIPLQPSALSYGQLNGKKTEVEFENLSGNASARLPKDLISHSQHKHPLSSLLCFLRWGVRLTPDLPQPNKKTVGWGYFFPRPRLILMRDQFPTRSTRLALKVVDLHLGDYVKSANLFVSVVIFSRKCNI